MHKLKPILTVAILSLAILACSLVTQTPPTPTPLSVQRPTPLPTLTPEAITTPPTEEPEQAPPRQSALVEPERLTGSIEVTNYRIIDVYYYERFVMLEDLTGFVQRDYEYIQPLDAQILGPITVQDDGTLTYTLNLPAKPISPHNDVDQDDTDDAGVQIWQVAMNANYMEDPFLGEDESGGWSSSYSSARIDAENKNEIYGGMLLVWSPDDQQEFPTSFGPDNLLFTEDDPVSALMAGYSIVNLDEVPFSFIKETDVTIPLFEGEISVNDYSDLGWLEAFSAMHEKVSREYPFTELKELDWEAMYAKFANQIETAEKEKDDTAYFLALRDYTWSIPDGHIGISYGEIGNQLYNQETTGGYGIAITGLDDDRVVANLIIEDGPAARVGITWGAEILEWNGLPIHKALDQVVPWSMPFSTSQAKRIQQYRYLLRDPIGTEVEVKFINIGETSPKIETLTAVSESKSFSATSVYEGYDFNALPVTYQILPEGIGYIKINSLSEDINLIIRLWEWALTRMIDMQIPSILIDLRQNSGGSPLGTLLASYFVKERIDISRSYYYSEQTGEFETYGPPRYTEPDDTLYYNGQIGVLVGPACASACENVAYVLSQLEQTRVFGFYASSGMFGEVARGQYLLPGGYSFQAPTGMDRDMQGNIIIEGTGVIPDVPVPLTMETIRSQYLDGEDVVLNYAIQSMNRPVGSGIMPESPPKMSTIPQAETVFFQGETPFLEQLALETYEENELSQAGRVYTYTIPLSTSRDLIWFYVWCTADETSFIDNWSKIKLDFSINDQTAFQDNFAVVEGVVTDSYCRAFYTVLSDFTAGEHILRTTVTFSEPLNDGIASDPFPAGTHTYEYHVIIAR